MRLPRDERFIPVPDPVEDFPAPVLTAEDIRDPLRWAYDFAPPWRVRQHLEWWGEAQRERHERFMREMFGG